MAVRSVLCGPRARARALNASGIALRRSMATAQPGRFRAQSDLCVASLQCNSQASTTSENLKHIQALLRIHLSQAPRQPDILLLPELFSTNYDLDNATAWHLAEPMVEERSPTLRHLRSWAREHKCYIGGSMMEATVDGHVYNSFVIYTPEGERINRTLRKSHPASIEAFSFNGVEPMDNHVLELDLSLLPAFASEKPQYLRPLRVGVSICYENALASVMRPLQKAQLDLLLSPFCAPEPTPMAGFDPQQCQQYRDAIESSPKYAAKWLNTYVVSSNKAGPWRTLNSRFLEMVCQWLQLSGVHAPDGSTLATLSANVNALCTSTVPLSPHPRPMSTEKIEAITGDLLLPFPRIVSVSFPLMETLGSWSYRFLKRGLRTRIVTERYLKSA